MKKSSLRLAALASFFVIGATATPALAEPVTPFAACGANDYNLVTYSTGYTFTRASGTKASVTGDPGVTLTISTSTSFTVTGTIGSNSQISFSAAVASINQSLDVSITAGFTDTSTTSGAWTVPASYTNGGRLEIGSRKYHGAVTKYRAKPADCSNGTVLSSINYNAPDASFHFQHTKL